MKKLGLVLSFVVVFGLGMAVSEYVLADDEPVSVPVYQPGTVEGQKIQESGYALQWLMYNGESAEAQSLLNTVCK